MVLCPLSLSALLWPGGCCFWGDVLSLAASDCCSLSEPRLPVLLGAMDCRPSTFLTTLTNVHFQVRNLHPYTPTQHKDTYLYTFAHPHTRTPTHSHTYASTHKYSK
ncbi:hypothetical protein AMECASPLE_039475 [Ameca splendens]|uniref:Secreted protein n=1 Tax=Ameca splendens TaxID=208324 RepID=A0ABV0ZTM1_9TELE